MTPTDSNCPPPTGEGRRQDEELVRERVERLADDLSWKINDPAYVDEARAAYAEAVEGIRDALGLGIKILRL